MSWILGSFLGLPDEILSLIFRNLADLPYTDAELTEPGALSASARSQMREDCLARLDLVHICLTCRRFNELATPLLYHTFVQQGWIEDCEEGSEESTTTRFSNLENPIPNCVRFMITLLKKPELTKHVRRIIWIARRVGSTENGARQKPSRLNKEQQLWDHASRLKALTTLQKATVHPRSANYLSALLHLERLQDLHHRPRLRSATRTLEGLLGLTRQINLLICNDGMCEEDEHRIRLDEHSIHPGTLQGLKHLSLDWDLVGSQHMRVITKTDFANLKRLTARFYDYNSLSLGPVVGKDTDGSWKYGPSNVSVEELCVSMAGHDTADLMIHRFTRLRKIEIRLNSIPHFLWGWRQWDDVFEALHKSKDLQESLGDLTLEAGEGDPQCRWPVAVGPDSILHMRKYRNLRVLSLHQSVFKQFAVNRDHPVAPLVEILPSTLERLRITDFDRGVCQQLDTFLSRLDSFSHLKRVEVVYGDFCLHDLYRDGPPPDDASKFKDYVAMLSQTLKSYGIQFVEVT
ncbi:hypothetical protein K461DRAFT_55937 [Myriangium duriaei CBS 260.36]|uniref:F-box domain-containing protein n=1 Tax=Myriangium duriaei CBS 260.36 TaxID=1168546 RepID=A0A9P4MDA6_9PEZI|nr:hypothetical protein K461DRAFT_55937 [Myriangium duriaei CBS 260.36]